MMSVMNALQVKGGVGIDKTFLQEEPDCNRYEVHWMEFGTVAVVEIKILSQFITDFVNTTRIPMN